ncbi:MAG: CBS domain-containing protein [Pseudomonadota bacterium]
MPSNDLQHALAQVPVRAAMAQPMKSARADWSVRDLIRFLIEERLYGVPVLNRDGDAIGVVTARDIIGFVNLDRDELEALLGLGAEEGDAGLAEARAAGRADENCRVTEIMTPVLLSVPVSASLLEAVRMMHRHQIHRVFVVEDGSVVGVVSSSTLVGALVGQYVAG